MTMTTTSETGDVERQDPRELVDEDKIKRTLESFYRTQRENDDLHVLVTKLTEQVAIERAKADQIDASLAQVTEQRDFYMRATVELRTQLSNAATILMSAGETLTKEAEQASKAAVYAPQRRERIQERTAETIARAPDLPRIVREGPAQHEDIPKSMLAGMGGGR